MLNLGLAWPGVLMHAPTSRTLLHHASPAPLGSSRHATHRPHDAHPCACASSCPALPCSIPYSLEVMKGGAMLGAVDLGAQSFYTFGRAPTNDVVLDHPSSSRQGETRRRKGGVAACWPGCPVQ